MTTKFPDVLEFLQSGAEISNGVGIAVFHKGRAGGDGGDYVAIAAGDGVEHGRPVRFWAIVFFVQTGEKQFLGLAKTYSDVAKEQELEDVYRQGYLAMKAKMKTKMAAENAHC